MRLTSHVRFWIGGGGSNPVADHTDLLQVQGESVRSLPPRRVIPFCMKTLDLFKQVPRAFSPLECYGEYPNMFHILMDYSIP